MEDLLQQVLDVLMPTVITILGIVLGYISTQVGTKAKELLEKKQIKQALENNKYIVQTSVDYVEQVFDGYDSQVKFEKAKEKAISIMQSKGIQVNEDEVDALIEQIVKGFNEGLAKGVATVEVPAESVDKVQVNTNATNVQ